MNNEIKRLENCCTLHWELNLNCICQWKGQRWTPVSSCMTKVFGAVKEAELVPSVPNGATTAEGQRIWILLVSEANGCITDSSYTTLVMWYNQLQCLFYSWSVGALLWLNFAFEELSDTSIDFVGFRQSACEYCYSDVCHSFFLSLPLSTNMLLIPCVWEENELVTA